MSRDLLHQIVGRSDEVVGLGIVVHGPVREALYEFCVTLRIFDCIGECCFNCLCIFKIDNCACYDTPNPGYSELHLRIPVRDWLKHDLLGVSHFFPLGHCPACSGLGLLNLLLIE